MSNYHHFNKSFSAKRAAALLCLLCMAGVAAWAQPTRLYIDSTATTQIAWSKVYDGNTSAIVTLVGTPVGIQSTHTNVALQATANYVDANVGGIKMVVVVYSLVGPDSIHYLPPFNDTLWAAISARPLSISGTTIDSAKVYSRSTLVNVQRVGTLSGVVPGDNVFPSAIARYLDPNVGVAKPVTVTYSLYGGDMLVCNNYIVPPTDTLTADITPREIVAPAVILANSKIYDGSVNYPIVNVDNLTGIYNGDSVTLDVTATTSSCNVGLRPVTLWYTLHGPQSFNYTIAIDTSITPLLGNILARPLGAQGAVVRTVKTYDGTVNARIVQGAFPANFMDGETVELITTATFDSPEIGTGKTITLHYDLVQNSYAANYSAPDDEVYTTDGKIIAPTVLDSAFGTNGIEVAADGYCPSEDDYATMTCHVANGNPSYYVIRYPEESAGWGPEEIRDTLILNGATTFDITFPIPEDFPEGRHTATITIGNEAGDEIVTTRDFFVNLSNKYLVLAFNDVVSIDNNSERFKTFQWYKNGEPIEGATLPYYQFSDAGSYSVRVNAGTENEHMICPININTSEVKSMTVAPNPVMNNTKVKIVGSDRELHVLVLYNSYGTAVLKTTFTGSEYILNMSNLPQGIYMLSVDDMNAKTVKL